MPFGQPDVSDSATYQVTLESDPSIPDSSAIISVTLAPADEGWTQTGVDALFQQLLDYLDAAPFLVPGGGAPALVGEKFQGVATSVTATPAPDPEP